MAHIQNTEVKYIQNHKICFWKNKIEFFTLSTIIKKKQTNRL